MKTWPLFDEYEENIDNQTTNSILVRFKTKLGSVGNQIRTLVVTKNLHVRRMGFRKELEATV